MQINNMTFKLAGEAGQGVESSGAGFTRAIARGGLNVFGVPDYMSRIRGGHNFFTLRVSDRPIYSHREEVHLLLPFNQEGIARHAHEVVPGGGIIFDESLKVDEAELARRGVRAMAMPLVKIAEEHGGRIMTNTAALGAAAGVTGYDFEPIAGLIRQNFARKGDAVVSGNLAVARAAYDMAAQRWPDFAFRLQVVPGAPQRMVLNGNQAFALGAMAAGCRFVSFYPMTPATSISEFLTARGRKLGVVTKQVEDEIAAILFAIGASHAGVRAMTATSGGGFSLMVEALGLAGMTETPLVIVEAQRGGPSTGLPTRTEQSDLEFVIHASHGEFPRLVLAPGTVLECFHAGARAFNLAEQFQTPVIVLTDMYQANIQVSVDADLFDFTPIVIDRGQTLSWEQLDTDGGHYQRHALTETGISPRALPGHPNAIWITTGDEHTSEGYITEDHEIRRQQMEKRMRKLEVARGQMRPPTRYGPEQAEVSLLCWGSSYGAVREAVDELNARGTSANLYYFVDLWPFPREAVERALAGARRLINVEMNYTGQLARLLRAETGIKVHASVLRYDGVPLTPEFIVRGVTQEVGVGV